MIDDKIRVIDFLLNNYDRYLVCISWNIYKDIEDTYVKNNQNTKSRLYFDTTIPNEQVEVYLGEINLIESKNGIISDYQNIQRYVNLKAFI